MSCYDVTVSRFNMIPSPALFVPSVAAMRFYTFRNPQYETNTLYDRYIIPDTNYANVPVTNTANVN